ncbi:MAG: hypothetical protein BMS9Abin13_100 [Patescibacteria group bacterium]|nr:MAG: hypothetical protein BMS9Abin13_100 [Patescibacteria group bacterium]
MNLLSLFTKDEPIGGLEISETHVRLAFLKLEDKKNFSVKIKALEEISLPAGVIQEGRVKDITKLVISLKELLAKTGALRYIIISLPSDTIYFHTYSFPKTLGDKKLEETMQLTVGFQLPIDPDTVYLDWEKMSAEEKNEIALAAAPKEVINAYLEAMRQVNIKTVAVEFHSLSFLRVAEIPEGGRTLVQHSTTSGTTLSVAEGRSLAFMRFLPQKYVSDKRLPREISKILKFYEVEKGVLPQTKEFEKLQAVEVFSHHSSVTRHPSKWIIALGAAARGLLPRSEDDIISLMPVGTEEAYEHQRAIAFSEFWSNLAVALVFFIVIIFVGTWLFMVSLQERSLGELESLSAVSIPTESSDLKKRAAKFNELIRKGVVLAQTLPRWQGVVLELRKEATVGIAISSLSLPSPEARMNITGIASDRETLNAYKRSLENSPLLADIDLPLTNLELGEDIPFNISFSLKNPGALYE